MEIATPGPVRRWRSDAAAPLVGVHNAWDAVMYHVFVKKRKQRETERHRWGTIEIKDKRISL